MERVGVGSGAFYKDATGVEGVDTHLAGSMNNSSVTHTDAHMDDAALGILEESEIVALDVTLTHFVATGNLLRGIARKPDAEGLEADLRETRAVDATCGTSSPKVGCAKEKALRELGSAIKRNILFVVQPPLVTIVFTAYLRPFLLSFQHFHRFTSQ